MSDIINIQSIETWPSEILDFLEYNLDGFVGWECNCTRNSSGPEYDQIIYKFRNILRRYSLIGYHCTKLVLHEIDEILTNGMSLQDLNTLSKRIDKLNENGLIAEDIVERLKTRNQANEENRAKMLWFCFFKPYIAGQSGIYRFFDSWGGEALYNSHESDPITCSELRRIGTPCIIKAKLPMNKLNDSYLPDTSMLRVFLESNEHTINNPTEHEGFSTENIPPDNILDIIKYPSQEFVELTRCDKWCNSII